MRNKIIYFFAFQFLAFFSHAQSVTDSYINPGYGTISGNVSLTYSIGDIFYGELSNDQLVISGMFPSQENKPVGIPPIPGENEILIYPNPCIESIYILTDIKENLYLSLYSLNGVLLKHVPFYIDQGIDVSHLPNGLFIIKITDIDHNHYFVDKLIKTN